MNLKPSEFLKYLDHLPQGFCIFDDKLNVLYWNQSLEILTDLERKLVVGVNLRVLCSKLNEDSYRLRLRHALASRSPIVFSAELHGRIFPSKEEGSSFHQTYMVPLDKDLNALIVEDVSKTYGVIHDYRQLVSKLTVAEQAAKKAEKLKSNFLANMSHEIRTPLHGIIGFCEEVLSDPNLSDKHRESLNMVLQSGQNLSLIVNDILDYSKIEANKLEIDPCPVHLKSLFDSLGQLHEKSIRKKSIEFKWDVNFLDDQWVKIDTLRLQQIFNNLITNAIKFTEKGKVEAGFYLDKRQDLLRVVGIVKDTGIGMSEEHLQSLFVPFQQADPSTTRIFGGTGLGLSIVKGLVDRMGGTISVSSKEGEGSCFEVSLPCVRTAPLVKIASVRQQVNGTEEAPLRILVAEDNEINRALLQHQLGKNPVYHLDFACNGLEAIQHFQQNSYDIVIMDCHMPIMDGYEAARKIKEQNSKVPIIALTASVLRHEVEDAHQSGMDVVVGKPAGKGKLEGIISRLLDGERFNAEASLEIEEMSRRKA